MLDNESKPASQLQSSHPLSLTLVSFVGQHEYFYRLLELRIMEKSPESNDRDGIYAVQQSVDFWSQRTRASQPWIHDTFYYDSCSIRTNERNLTLDVDDNIDYFISGAYSNEKICQRIMNDCVGEHQQFESEINCVNFYEALPETDPSCLSIDTGLSYALQGNTTLCRFSQHFMTKTTPQIHCYHVGKGDRPDANGNFRCASTDCHSEEVEVTHDAAARSSNNLNEEDECPLVSQVEVEMRLISSLPHCLDAIRRGSCGDDDCKRALRQFGLVGNSTKEKMRLSKALKCGNKIKSDPLSVILRVSGFNALDLLGICGNDNSVKSINSFLCGRNNDEGRYLSLHSNECEHVNSTLLDKTPEMLRLISAYYGRAGDDDVISNDTKTLMLDLHLVDVEAVRLLAPNVTELYLLAFGDWRMQRESSQLARLPITDVPFVGGPIVMNYRDVLRAIREPDQQRSAASFARQVGQFNQPAVGSSRLSVMLSTRSKAHGNAMAMVAAAWPMLRVRTTILLPALGDELEHQIKATFMGISSELETVKQDMATWVFQANLDHLFPDNQGMTGEVSTKLWRNDVNR
jgi:hypothetical protein